MEPPATVEPPATRNALVSVTAGTGMLFTKIRLGFWKQKVLGYYKLLFSLVYILPFPSFLSIQSRHVRLCPWGSLQWRQTDRRNEAAKAGWGFGGGTGQSTRWAVLSGRWGKLAPREGAQVCAHGDLRLMGTAKGPTSTKMPPKLPPFIL